MKSLITDWYKFTWLQRVLVLIDLILNPRATDYPFLYGWAADGQVEQKPPRNYLVVKRFKQGNNLYLWCIRWI